jgi:3-polyprenyl-4-hydroxybenzoate decarboxylase
MRAFKDLREFLQLLEGEKQLLRISEKVSLEPDLAKFAIVPTIPRLRQRP